MEQPIDANNGNAQEQILITNSPTENSNQEGSTFGKFKDATSLLNAYKTLEKEFTKKSQKLSTLLKNQANSEESTANIGKNDILDDKNCVFNKNDDINDTIKKQDMNNIREPLYKQKSWLSKVNSFFESNSDAKKYAPEIADIILADKDLSCSENCLNYAYNIAKAKAYVEPAKLLDDPNFIKQILSNENIKNKIIQSYIDEIRKSKQNLRVISGTVDDISFAPTKSKPKNLKEASLVFKKYLES